MPTTIQSITVQPNDVMQHSVQIENRIEWRVKLFDGSLNELKNFFFWLEHKCISHWKDSFAFWNANILFLLKWLNDWYSVLQKTVAVFVYVSTFRPLASRSAPMKCRQLQFFEHFRSTQMWSFIKWQASNAIRRFLMFDWFGSTRNWMHFFSYTFLNSELD